MLLAESNMTLILVATIGTIGSIFTSAIAGWFAWKIAQVQRQGEAIPPDAEQSANGSGQPADAKELPKDSGQRNGKSTKSYRQWTIVMYVSMALTLFFGGTLVITGRDVTAAVQSELRSVVAEAADFRQTADMQIARLEKQTAKLGNRTRQFEQRQDVLERVVSETQFQDTDIRKGLEQLQAFQDLLIEQGKGGPDALVRMQEAINSLLPVGSIVPYAGSVLTQEDLPSGWLLCDGSAVDRTMYPDLFSAIGVAWGAGDMVNTFHLPDLRGRFLRGVDKGAGNDPDSAGRTASNPGGRTGDNIGSFQQDNLASHLHLAEGGAGNLHTRMTVGPGGLHWKTRNPVPWWKSDSAIAFTGVEVGSPLSIGIEVGGSTAAASGSLGAEDNRPVNCYVNYIIKY